MEKVFEDALARHGDESNGVGWPDPRAQILRFEKLAYLLDADRESRGGEPYTVSDWGCGYGAMFEFLDARAGGELAAYRGYDISAKMIEAARERVTDPRAEFIEATEIVAAADYTFVSGTFHITGGASDEEWGAYVRKTMLEIAGRSRRGFAFNLFSDQADWRRDDLFHADPAEFFAFCRDEISPRVALLSDYPLHEWTISVIHDVRGQEGR